MMGPNVLRHVYGAFLLYNSTAADFGVAHKPTGKHCGFSDCSYFVVVSFRCVGLRAGAAVHSRGHQAPVLHELLHGGDEDRLETQVRSPLSRRPCMWSEG